MKKKITKKHSSKKQKVTQTTFVLSRFIILPLVLLLAVVSGKFLFGAATQVHVLGVMTGPVLLADKGSEDSGSGSSGGGDSGSSGGSNSGTSGESSSGGSGSSGGTATSGTQSTSGGNQTTQASVGSDTLVDCVGPDGRHFTTSFHDCQELNQKWGNQSFTFTPLAAPNTETAQQPEQPEAPKTHQTFQTPQGTLEVQTEGNKGQVNLQTAGLHIEIKQEDNGTVQLTAKQENGTEIQLHDNALTQINDALKEKDVEVGTSSAGVTLRSGDTIAETKFPLSLDAATNQLAVTTPNGTKDVAVLPNQAVSSLLQKGIVSNVLATADQTTASTGAALNSVTLTEVNNQPAFEVQGVLNKKLLGLFPVAFAKTVAVSAQTGQVLQTQQSLINQILQALSF